MKKFLLATAVLCLLSGAANAADLMFTELGGSPILIIDFGDVDQPGFATQQVLISNISDDRIRDFSVELTGPIVKGPTPSASVSGCSLGELFPGENCVASVTFTPQRNGKFKGKLEASGNVVELDSTLRDISETRDIKGQDLPNE